ncbi:MAG: hypothetical protein R3B49_03550 [Phycisphaerales bacterium]
MALARAATRASGRESAYGRSARVPPIAEALQPDLGGMTAPAAHAEEHTGLGPLSPEHVVQLRQAHRKAKKLHRARRIAGTSGWTTLLLGVCALPFGLADAMTLALGVAFIAVGYHELALRPRLSQLDRGAPMTLAMNQVILGIIIIAYAVWQLIQGLSPTDPGPASALASDPAFASDPQLAQLAGLSDTMERLTKMVNLGVYGGLIAGTLLVQGLTARYYASRRKHLDRFLAETPGWIINLHRARVLD